MRSFIDDFEEDGRDTVPAHTAHSLLLRAEFLGTTTLHTAPALSTSGLEGIGSSVARPRPPLVSLGAPRSVLRFSSTPPRAAGVGRSSAPGSPAAPPLGASENAPWMSTSELAQGADGGAAAAAGPGGARARAYVGALGEGEEAWGGGGGGGGAGRSAVDLGDDPSLGSPARAADSEGGGLLWSPGAGEGGGGAEEWLGSPRRAKRRISKVPFKVLDAPSLMDDYYLHVVDWSSRDVLAVALGATVYLWDAKSADVTRLCTLSPPPGASAAAAAATPTIASLRWTPSGSHVALGTSAGEVQVWDVTRRAQTTAAHVSAAGRCAVLDWADDHALAAGCRDRSVSLWDFRASNLRERTRLAGHSQEVCGLRWSPDRSLLASGGNDNRVLVWSMRGGREPETGGAVASRPATRGARPDGSVVHKFALHRAAVKALAWSPHKAGLLASGGGSADRCLRFWDTDTGEPLACFDTGSQVCNLHWSDNADELVSAHGFSMNQIIVWKWPSMRKLAVLSGHTMRVLYLAVSPDGQTVVTGAGDETLRFWKVFPHNPAKPSSGATPKPRPDKSPYAAAAAALGDGAPLASSPPASAAAKPLHPTTPQLDALGPETFTRRALGDGLLMSSAAAAVRF